MVRSASARAGRDRHQDLGPASAAPSSSCVRAAFVAAALLCGIAAFHAALVLGAPWGELTQGGGTTGSLDTTGRVVAAVSCLIAMVMAAAILGRVGRGPLAGPSPRVRSVLAWALMGYALLGVVANLVTRSAGERNLWEPVSVVLLVLVAFVLHSTRRPAVG